MKISAQKSTVIKYSVEDGLPSVETYKIVQDSNHFYWIVSDQGVSRFNGEKFENFTSQDGLCYNTNFSMYVDHKGRVWFNSYTGCLTYFENGQFSSYKYNDSLLKYSNAQFYNSIYVDKNDNVFLHGAYRSLSIDSQGNVSNQIDNVPASDSSYIIIDKRLPHVIQRFSPGAKFKDRVRLILPERTIETKFKSPIYDQGGNARLNMISQDNYIYITLNKSLLVIDSIGQINEWRSQYQFTHGLLIDKDNSLWVGTQNGCYKFPNSDIEQTPEYYFPNHSISSIYQDQNNEHWFTSLNSGLINLPKQNFRYLEIKNLHSNIDCDFLFQNKSDLYVGSRNGTIAKVHEGQISRIGNVEHIIDAKSTPDYQSTLLFTPTTTYSLGTNSLQNLNKLLYWNGYFNHDGTYRFFKRNKDKPFNLFLDQDYHVISGISQNDLKKIVNSIPFRSGVLYYNNTTLYYWDFTNDSVFNLAQVDSIFDTKFIAVEKLQDKVVLSISGGGLLIYGGENLIKINTKNGLVSDFCDKIAVNGNEVWAGSTQGLSHVVFDKNDYTKYTIQNYTSLNGLKSNNIRDLLIYKDNLLVANPSGINFLPLQNNIAVLKAPIAQIMAVKLVGEDENLQKGAVLKYYKNQLVFHFDASTKNYRQVLMFDCFLIDKNKKDTQVLKTKNNEAVFSNLSPGKYEFKVRSRLKNRNLKGEFDTFSFEIKAAYWQTVWFKILLWLGSSLTLIFIVFSINARKRKKLWLEKQMNIRDLEVQVAKEKLSQELMEKQHLVEITDVKNRELVAMTLSMGEQNAILDDVKSSVKSLRNASKTDRIKKITQLLATISYSKAKANNWDTFMKHFSSVHPDFKNALQESHPELSELELKYCAFMKISLSTKEIASLLNVTESAVNTAKFRIRKKMNLNSNAELKTYLMRVGA